MITKHITSTKHQPGGHRTSCHLHPSVILLYLPPAHLPQFADDALWSGDTCAVLIFVPSLWLTLSAEVRLGERNVSPGQIAALQSISMSQHHSSFTQNTSEGRLWSPRVFLSVTSEVKAQGGGSPGQLRSLESCLSGAFFLL